MNRNKLSLVKAATVAIGVTGKEVLELRKTVTGFADIQSDIVGTGFFISSDGYVMTAWHVFEKCKRLCQAREKRIVINTVSAVTSQFMINIVPIAETIRVLIREHSEAYVGPTDLDIGIGKVEGRAANIPCLQIKEPQAMNIYDEIAMCGYPNGNQSLDLSKRYVGLRFSPIIQVGRISGFMPTDTHPNPYGIQTDIIGTGGSSGSPIVDTSDGKVVGIAQQVIKAGLAVNANPKQLFGETFMGLVYGISSGTLHGIYEKVRNFLERRGQSQFILPGSGFGTVTFRKNC